MIDPRIINSSAYQLVFVIVCGILALTGLFVLYQEALYGPFTFDDVLVFPSTQLQTLNNESVLQTLAMHNSGIFGRPTAILSFILNYHFLGAEPYGYKLVNLLVHFVNSCLIFLFAFLIAKLVSDNGISSSDTFIGQTTISGNISPLIPAALCTALWACHPLQVSTVMYVFQRTVLLSTFFTLIALLLYLYARSQPKLNLKGYVALFILFPVALLLAVTSKENGALILPLVLVLEIVLFKFAFRRSKRHDACCWFLVLMVGVPLLLAMAYFASHTSTILEGYESRSFTMTDRLRTETVALLFYLKLITVPSVSDMSLYHDAFPVFTEFSLPVLASSVTLILLASSVFLLRHRHPVIALGVGIFITAHLLESTLIPLEPIFEHRNYFAVFGVAFPVAWYLTGLTRRNGKRTATWIASGLLLAVLSSQTYSRSIEWSDELLMNTLAVQNNPDSLRARKLLITTLSNTGNHDGARRELDAAMSLNPNSPSLHLLSLAIQCNATQPIDDIYKAATDLVASSRLIQDIPGLLNGLIAQSSANACEGLPLDRMQSLTSIASDNPDKRMPKIFKLTLYALSAQLLMRGGENEAAMAELDRALHEVPHHPEVLIAQTTLRIQSGNVEEAQVLLGTLENVNKQKLGAYSRAVEALQNDLKIKVAEHDDT